MDIILEHNINSNNFPYFGALSGFVKRWELPVPVKTGDDERVTQALDEIENKLGKTIFDRETIKNVPDSKIDRGIVFSFGTAVGPGQTACEHCTGNVSEGPNLTGWPQQFLKPTGRISGRLYINLDNSLGEKADVDIVIHEMGHALGLDGKHFKGFGDEEGPIGPEFWDVVADLYGRDFGPYRKP